MSLAKLNKYVLLEIIDYLEFTDIDKLYFVTKHIRKTIQYYINYNDYNFRFMLHNTHSFFDNRNEFPYLTLAYMYRILHCNNNYIIKYVFDTYSVKNDFYYIFSNYQLYHILIGNDNFTMLKYIDNMTDFIRNTSEELYDISMQYHKYHVIEWLLSRHYKYYSAIYYIPIQNTNYDDIIFLMNNKFEWDITVIKYIKKYQSNSFLKWFIKQNLVRNNYNLEFMDPIN
jgi:hypothetical protein